MKKKNKRFKTPEPELIELIKKDIFIDGLTWTESMKKHIDRLVNIGSFYGDENFKNLWEQYSQIKHLNKRKSLDSNIDNFQNKEVTNEKGNRTNTINGRENSESP